MELTLSEEERILDDSARSFINGKVYCGGGVPEIVEYTVQFVIEKTS